MSSFPGVNISLQTVSQALNPQYLSSTFMVCGIMSKGTVNTPVRFNNLADVASKAGNGPGAEQVAEIGINAGWPVFGTPTNPTSPSTLGSAVKIPVPSGTPLTIPGSVLLAGADHNGDILVVAKVPGVQLTVTAAAMGTYGWSLVNGQPVLTVNSAAVSASTIAGYSLTAVSAVIASVTAQGTGASNGISTSTTANIGNGDLNATALVAGALLVGASTAGVIYYSDQAGVDVQVVNGTSLQVYQSGTTLVVQIISGTTLASQVVTAVNLAGLLGVQAVAYDGGTGNAATIGATALAPLEFALTVAGASTAEGITMSASTITIASSTNSNSEPTGTATAAAAEVTGWAADLMTLTASGTGAGLASPQSATALSFGSSGSVSASVTSGFSAPTDGYNLQVQVVRGGTPGGSPPMTIQWAVDVLAGTSLTPNWIGELLVPAGGVVPIRNSVLDTGITLTFSGTFAAGDEFVVQSTTPTTGSSDLNAALAAAIAQYDTVGPWGAVSSPDPVSKAEATLLDTQLQEAFPTTFIQGYWNTRDYNSGESDSTWQTSIITDYQGFVSTHGLSGVAAGAFLHDSAYTFFQYRRPLSIAAAARKAAIPMHQGLGRKLTGPIARCLYISHDERAQTGLWTQRFITATTYPREPGAYYFMPNSPTMADPDDVGYSTTQWVATACDLGRNLFSAASTLVGDSLAFQAAADPSTGSVAGALTILSASSIETPLNKIASDLLFSIKSDGKPSASPYPLNPPPGGLSQPCTVTRVNDYAQDRTVYINAGFYPLGETEFVNISIAAIIP